MADIRHLVIIDVPPDTVYDAITREEGLRGWWTPEAFAQQEVGSIAEFKFGEGYHNKMRVLRLEPPALVEWECLEGDPEWVGTRFLLDLEADGRSTILRFSHGRWRKVTDFFASATTDGAST